MGVKSGERVCLWQRASLETLGAEQIPSSPIIAFHVWPLAVINFLLSLAQGPWGIPPQISRYLTPQCGSIGGGRSRSGTAVGLMGWGGKAHH